MPRMELEEMQKMQFKQKIEMLLQLPWEKTK
jgi:hypothetical protein